MSKIRSPLRLIVLMAAFAIGFTGLIGFTGTGSPATLYAGPLRLAGTCSPARAAVSAGTSIHTLKSGGLTRTYQIHVPASYDPAVAVPLVLSLHGYMSNTLEQAALTGWDRLADSKNFVLVYPQASGSPTRWHSGGIFDVGTPVDDVGFIGDLITSLETDLCIDPLRIYVNGMSNGGGMTNLLACKLADRIVAVGMVSGAYMDVPGGCTPARAIPVLAFHGTADPVVNYAGDPRLKFADITTWIAEWASRNECSTTPEKIDVKGDVSGIHYKGCKDNADVILYTIDGGGHTWPGGLPVPMLGKTSRDINASATMWEFFTAHPLPSPDGQ